MQAALTWQVASIMPLTCGQGISAFLAVSRLITSSCALDVPCGQGMLAALVAKVGLKQAGVEKRQRVC
jgi:2-polyprenyl-3-methyl-5-hydroxy-6-metoxy-1,4-benzoquinol methylase